MRPALPAAATLGALLLLLAPSARAQCVPLPNAGLSGCGLSTPFGLATIACSGAPSVGNGAFAVTANLPCVSSLPLLLVGSCLAPPQTISGPFGTNAFCGPTMAPCVAFVGPAIFLAVPGVSTGAGFAFPLPIPNDPALIGATVCAQEINLCILFVGQCLMVSHGLSITVT